MKNNFPQWDSELRTKKTLETRRNIVRDVNCYNVHMRCDDTLAAVLNLSITAILRRVRRTPSLSVSPEAAAAAGWQCRFNKCPWRVVGMGTNRLEPQTQCLVMATDGFSQWVPLDMAGSPGYYTSRCPSVIPWALLLSASECLCARAISAIWFRHKSTDKRP